MAAARVGTGSRRRRVTGRVGALGTVVALTGALAGALAGAPASAAATAPARPVPTALTVVGEKVCAGRALVPDGAPLLLATATGSPSDRAVLQLELRAGSGTLVATTQVDASVGLPTRFQPSTPADGTYSFRARETTRDDTGALRPWGAWTGSGRFTVDTTAPAAPTGASSLDVPLSAFADPPGAPAATSWDPSQPVLDRPGSIVVTTPRGVSLVQVRWDDSTLPAILGCGVDGPGVVPVVEGRVDVPIPPTLTSGPHRLYVRGVDAVGNVGPTLTEGFGLAPYVAGYRRGADRVEGESLAVRAPSGAPAGVQRDVRLSGGAQLTVATSRPGQQVRLDVPVAQEGDYALQLGALAADHRGRVQVLVDGVLQLDGQGDPLVVDLYAPTTRHVEEYASGGVLHLTAGTHTVTLVTTDPDPAARDRVTGGVHDHGCSLVVDYVRLVRFPG